VEWNRLWRLPIETWMPPALAAEIIVLNELIDGLEAERGRLDRLEAELLPFAEGFKGERLPFLTPAISLCEREVAFRERSDIVFHAGVKAVSEAANEAAERLRLVELGIRKRLGLREHEGITAAMRQCDKAWWTAFHAAADVPSIGDYIDRRRENSGALLHLGRKLEEFRRAVAGEPMRVRRIAESQEAENEKGRLTAESECRRLELAAGKDAVIAGLLR